MDIGADPGESAIRVEKMSIRLGSGASAVDVLSDIDLLVPRGQALSLVGPSGSGKSTLLMAMAGLERPQAGRMFLDAEDLTAHSEDGLARIRGRAVGIVFQAFHLIPNMTALENVAVPLELAGHRDAFARAENELRIVGLGDRLTHYPAELSGGEQQRVAIARALAPAPAILLADEPTGNLDSANGAMVASLIFDTARLRGMTLVMVTHDETLAERADRIVRLQSGRIVADELMPRATTRA